MLKRMRIAWLERPFRHPRNLLGRIASRVATRIDRWLTGNR